MTTWSLPLVRQSPRGGRRVCVVLSVAYRPDCAQFIRLIHVLIKYDVIAVTVNNIGVDSSVPLNGTMSGREVQWRRLFRAQGGTSVLFLCLLISTM